MQNALTRVACCQAALTWLTKLCAGRCARPPHNCWLTGVKPCPAGARWYQTKDAGRPHRSHLARGPTAGPWTAHARVSSEGPLSKGTVWDTIRHAISLRPGAV